MLSSKSQHNVNSHELLLKTVFIFLFIYCQIMILLHITVKLSCTGKKKKKKRVETCRRRIYRKPETGFWFRENTAGHYHAIQRIHSFFSFCIAKLRKQPRTCSPNKQLMLPLRLILRERNLLEKSILNTPKFNELLKIYQLACLPNLSVCANLIQLLCVYKSIYIYIYIYSTL